MGKISEQIQSSYKVGKYKIYSTSLVKKKSSKQNGRGIATYHLKWLGK